MIILLERILIPITVFFLIYSICICISKYKNEIDFIKFMIMYEKFIIII